LAGLDELVVTGAEMEQDWGQAQAFLVHFNPQRFEASH
jgi:hypothetical protein